jgi:hypothetical protein
LLKPLCEYVYRNKQNQQGKSQMSETHTQRIAIETNEIIDVFCSKHGIYSVEFSDGQYEVYGDHAALNTGLAKRVGRTSLYIAKK